MYFRPCHVFIFCVCGWGRVLSKYFGRERCVFVFLCLTKKSLWTHDTLPPTPYDTVRLTSVDNPVPGNQEICFAHLQTIVGQVKKIRSPTWGIVWRSLLAETSMIDRSLYILLNSHSSVCRLLSNLNFKLLMSVTYVHVCVHAPCVDESRQRMNETHDKVWLTCHWWHHQNFKILK